MENYNVSQRTALFIQLALTFYKFIMFTHWVACLYHLLALYEADYG